MFTTLLLKSDVLQFGTWKSYFLLVLYSYMSEFLLKYMLFFFMQLSTSEIYHAVTVRTFSSLKIRLQDSFMQPPN